MDRRTPSEGRVPSGSHLLHTYLCTYLLRHFPSLFICLYLYRVVLVSSLPSLLTICLGIFPWGRRHYPFPTHRSRVFFKHGLGLLPYSFHFSSPFTSSPSSLSYLFLSSTTRTTKVPDLSTSTPSTPCSLRPSSSTLEGLSREEELILERLRG